MSIFADKWDRANKKSYRRYLSHNKRQEARNERNGKSFFARLKRKKHLAAMKGHSFAYRLFFDWSK